MAVEDGYPLHMLEVVALLTENSPARSDAQTIYMLDTDFGC
jgi:hypothetical protein